MPKIFFRYNPVDPLESRLANYPAAGPEVSEAQMLAIKRYFHDRDSRALVKYLRSEGLIDAAEKLFTDALTTGKPWLCEPDSLDFTHAGLNCAIRRVFGSGHLCGYVRLPECHPWSVCRSEWEVPAQVHGGVTFGPEGLAGGRDDLWVGFDCAHIGDLIPAAPSDRGGEYRDLAYVKAQCESLAQQVIDSGERDHERRSWGDM